MGPILPARFLSYTGFFRPGLRRAVPVPAPAAGADWIINVPGGVEWFPLSIFATLTTSATVANRDPQLTVVYDGLTVFQGHNIQNITASQVKNFTWTHNVTTPSAAPAGNSWLYPGPRFNIAQGGTLGTVTVALSAADQWSNITVLVEEYYLTTGQLSEMERQREIYEQNMEALAFERYEQHAGVS